MSESYIDTTNGYTNLVNPQVYNAAEGLACGWKWMCQDPCCKNPAWPRGRCSCCDMCDTGDGDGENPGGGEYSDEPCCYNGTCCPCKTVSGDAPPLYPQSIGCGRRHICKVIKTLPICAEQVDEGTSYADLPGRPPHTIVCVRATGSAIVNNFENCPLYDHAGHELGDLNLINKCDDYDLWVRFKIPIEIIVRDCAGYLYCLKSFITELVKIPLTARVHFLGDSYIYAKVRIRLCYPNKAELIPLYDNDGHPLGNGPTACANVGCMGPTSWNCINHIVDNAFRLEDASDLAECLIAEEDAKGCSFKYTFGTYHCEERDSANGPDLKDRCWNGNPKLDILIEACVVRLIPGGNGNNGSPYVCVPEAGN